MEKLTIEEKLGRNRFKPDEANSHIQINKEPGQQEELRRLCLACPAGLYKINEAGVLQFDHLGCLECGTCRVLSSGRIIKTWNYPLGGFGISFRDG